MSRRSEARTAADVERGLMPPHVSVKEPHWYLNIVESGCVLCGRVPYGSQQRMRMPGKPPKDPRKRYVVDEHDWACDDHFM